MTRAIALFACLLSPALATAQPSVPSPRLSAAECEVWARETSFARSVAEGDAESFREHLHEDTVFGVKSPAPQRGRDAVVEGWAGIIEGKALKLRWYPTMVAVDGSGELAYSSGPALYERADGQDPDHRLGAFQSIWRRGDDGVWRVVFDDGIRPQPATPEQVEAFMQGGPSACPRG